MVAELIVTHSKSLDADRVLRGSLYHRAVRHARGVPIEGSLAAAREALRLMQEAYDRDVKAYKQLPAVSVIYNRLDYKRFRFRELYSLPKNDNRLEKYAKLPEKWRDNDWTAVPQTTVLALVPPADIIEALYEVEALRRVPIREAVERTVGVPPKLTPSSIAELAAKTAHNELMDTLRNGRFPFMGEHLLQSAARQGLYLAKAGSAILKAAYGERAGVTLVSGDDALWSCLPAGVAARIAVRHLTIFERAEQARLQATGEDGAFRSAIGEWRFTQRAIVDLFTTAWVAQAQQHLAETSKDTPPPLNRRAVAVEAVRSFARVNALCMPGAKAPVLVVAASYSALLTTPGNLAAILREVAVAISAEETHARAFKDHQQMDPPQPKDRQAFFTAAWASRRIDADAMRGWKIDPTKDEPLVDVTTALSQLGVEDAAQRHYYCPMGSRVDGLPGRQPFAIAELGARLVWLTPLADAVDRVLGLWDQVAAPARNGSMLLRATPVPKLGQGPGGVVGLGRHPLVLTAEGGGVHTLLATEDALRGVFPTDVDSLQDAIGLFGTNPAASVEVQRRTAATRSIAFNADRLVSALDLVLQNNSSDVLHVSLPSSVYATSLCIALAMHRVERRALILRLQVHVNDAEGTETTRAHLQGVVEKCRRAVAAGCKAVVLAEACATLAE